MSNILTIAYAVEGPTDERFLGGIIQRTFEDIAFNCETDIEVYPISLLPSPKLGSWVDNVLQLSKDAFERGIQVLCIHVDADNASQMEAFANKINPAFKAVLERDEELCKNLVAVIPVHMSEAWMLANKELFKEELGTSKSNADLNIARKPESIADPKETIENAIRIAESDLPRKSRRITVTDLYQPLGQTIPLSDLVLLPSYDNFRTAVLQAFRTLNYLR